MPFECSQEVANDLEKLLEDDEGYDVIIYAGENENVKAIHAHSNILRTRSQYFRAAFSNEWAEKKDGKFIFKKPNISPQTFNIILRFIYCGKVDLEKLQGPEILKLLIAVDELNNQTLNNYVQEYLIKHQHEFLLQNPIGILEAVYQHEAFTDLFNFCLEKICEEPEILFNSDKFIRLKAPSLELILERDDLYSNEVVIWDSLLKWCLAQHSNISQDVTQWSKEDITMMGRTIHRFVPLIRFYSISSDDFILKVYPYKKIIPKDLINNILIFHMAPNEKLNINAQPPRQTKYIYDSILINAQHFAIFASWIEKKNDSYYNTRKIPYNFNLLYRASRDGNTNAAFHEKCDNKGATIVIVKIKNSDQIVGGYNPISWDQRGNYIPAADSFLFTSRNNIQNTKVGYYNGQYSPIGCYATHGPIFGNGGELFCRDGTWYSGNPRSYSNIDGMPTEGEFNIDDYEVFQVTRVFYKAYFQHLTVVYRLWLKIFSILIQRNNSFTF